MKTTVEQEIEKALLEGARWNVIAKTLHVSNRTIAKVSKRMNEVKSPPPPASQVFTMFEKGTSPMDIVKDTNADPEIILEWFDAWLNMNKGWRSWREFTHEQERTAKMQENDGKEAHRRRDWREKLRLEKE